MKNTDYSKIASKYDKNKYRQEIKPDKDLEDSISTFAGSKFRVLDLACGTGLFLQKHEKYFNDNKIEWNGLDASEDMLIKATDKVTSNVKLIKGFAEEMPYDSDYFNFIINNYAFQHFSKKSETLDEIYRVLAKDGIFKMHNTDIHSMKRWWLYQYFPTAYYEDLKRYWQKELIYQELLIRNLEVELKVEYVLKEVKLNEIIDFARNRDISVLTLIDDKEYMAGLEKMEYELSNDSEAKIVVDFADLFIISKKK